MEHRADLELARQAACADRTAFGALFEGSFDRVYAFVRRRASSREAAERATERILARAFDQLSDYDGSVAFSTWLLAVLKAELRASAPTPGAALAADSPLAGPRA
jgi:DNA-directed RNA polymerase specialized sigma24 family protein